MPEVTPAVVAVHLGAHHSPGSIEGAADRAFERREEAWPSRSAFELAVRDEQPLAATHASERAGAMLPKQRTRTGTLGAVAAKDVVLLGSQIAAPLFIGFLDGKCGCS